MACNLVTNFEVALIKKLWQCSVLSRTQRVALPSPPPHLGVGEVEGYGYTRDPCDISIGLSRIPLDNICVYSLRYSGYSRSVGARSCRSGRRKTGTQIGLIGKTENHIGYQIRKPVCIFRENRKPNAKKRKIRKPQ